MQFRRNQLKKNQFCVQAELPHFFWRKKLYWNFILNYIGCTLDDTCRNVSAHFPENCSLEFSQNFLTPSVFTEHVECKSENTSRKCLVQIQTGKTFSSNDYILLNSLLLLDSLNAVWSTRVEKIWPRVPTFFSFFARTMFHATPR